MIERFRRKPAVMSMIRWDGSDEALREIIDAGAQPQIFTDGLLKIWVDKFSGHATVYHRDWVVLESDGHGVYPLTAADHETMYEAAVEDIGEVVPDGWDGETRTGNL